MRPYAAAVITILSAGCWEQLSVSHMDDDACSYSRKACLRWSICNPIDPPLAAQDADAVCKEAVKADCTARHEIYPYQIRSITLPPPPSPIRENYLDFNLLKDIDGDGGLENRLGFLLNYLSPYQNFNQYSNEYFKNHGTGLLFSINSSNLKQDSCAEIQFSNYSNINSYREFSLLASISTNGHFSTIPSPLIPWYLEKSLQITLPIFGQPTTVMLRGLSLEGDIGAQDRLTNCVIMGAIDTPNLSSTLRRSAARMITQFLLNYEDTLEKLDKDNAQEAIIMLRDLLSFTMRKFVSSRQDERRACIATKGCCAREVTSSLCQISEDELRNSEIGPLFEFDISVLDAKGYWKPDHQKIRIKDALSVAFSIAIAPADSHQMTPNSP